MNLVQFLNTILLSLSLATVLMTMISFLIYKIRRFTSEISKPDADRLEGAFFRRYAPELRALQAKKAKGPKQVSRAQALVARYMPKNLGVGAFFASVTLVLFITFFGERVMSFRRAERERAENAQFYRKLASGGLLSRQELDESALISKVEEEKAPIQSRLDHISRWLSSRKIVLLESSFEKTRSRPEYPKLLSSIEQTLKTVKAKVQRRKELSGIKPGDVVILPLAESLSRKNRDAIESHLRQGGGVIAFGPVGIYDGTGDPAGQEWATGIFGVESARKVEGDWGGWVSFGAGITELLSVPTGFLALAPVLEPDLKFRSVRGFPSAFEVSGNGRPVGVSDERNPFTGVLANYNVTENGRSAWFAFDFAKTLEGNADAANQYRNLLLTSLGWVTKLPTATVSAWPLGESSVIVPALSIHPKTEVIDEVVDIFADHRIPLTVFFQSDWLERNAERVKQIQWNDRTDFGTMTDSAEKLVRQPINDVFDRIQVSRLLIEEKLGRRVSGLLPPDEKWDVDIVGAASQNRLDYVMGGRSFTRAEPVKVNGAPIMIFPRIVQSDFDLYQNKELAGFDDLKRAMLEEQRRVSALGGMYLMRIHSHIFGDEKYLKVLREVLKNLKEQKAQFWTAGELAKWALIRDRIVVEARRESPTAPGMTIVISNQGREAVKNLRLKVDSLGVKSWKVAEGKPVSVPVKIQGFDSDMVLELESLRPGVEVQIPLEAASP